MHHGAISSDDRVDYDDGKSTSWDWAHVGPSFHEFEKFGTLVFE